jgi:hypothetical protein
MILAAGFTTGPNAVSYNSSAPSKNHLFESIEQFLFRPMHMYDIAHIHDRIAGTILRKCSQAVTSIDIGPLDEQAFH